MSAPSPQLLLIDDDDVDREKFRRLSLRSGLELEITEAASAAEGLRMLAVRHFDAAVVDYRLGDMTGIELCRAIKQQHRTLPVIMLTGLGDERVAVSAMREGVYEYLTKSNLTAADIAQTVSAALRSADLERKLTEANAAREVAESAANEREAQIQGLFEASSVGILLTAPDGSVLRVNPALCRLCGYSERELGAMRLPDLFHPGDGLDVLPGARGPLVSPFEAQAAELCLRHEDGSQIWVALDMSPVRDAANAVSSVAVFVQDVRGRRQAELLLRDSERRFRNLVSNVPIGIFENDARGDCTFVNDAWTRITGWSATDTVGKDGIQCVHPDDRSAVLTEWEHARRERRDFGLEFRFVTPEGRVVWVSVRIRPTHDDTGDVTGYLGTVKDITERKSQQASLVAAKEAAEAAARTKADFLARMSHEIRTPMNSVIGMTELILQTELSDEQREFLGMANGAAKSLLHLINDILDFSRSDAGRLSLEQVCFDLRACVEGTVQRLRHRAEEKGLSLHLGWAEGVPRYVKGDANRLTQVMTNLLSNAIKFTERGAVAVQVAAEAVEPGRCSVHISVADTGIGVPRHKQGVIFDAFAQADESISRQFGGTGLGLAICAQLVELMRGSLWVESEEGRGSTFQFRVELALASDEEGAALAASAAQQRPPSSERPYPIAARRILVAEDNYMSQRLIQALLTRAGHDVTIVGDGQSALDQLETNAFDLVLMDVQMAGMSGLEAVERIRAREAGGGRRVPVVALTAQAMGGDAERCLAAGMDGYLSKPVVIKDLERIIARTSTPQPAPPRAARDPGVPFDPTALRQRIGEDPALFAELCALFESRAGVLLRQLRDAVDAREAGAMKSAAHELKGMLMNLVATEASQLARELELAGAAAEFDGGAVRVVRLDDEVQRVLAALRSPAPGSKAQPASALEPIAEHA